LKRFYFLTEHKWLQKLNLIVKLLPRMNDTYHCMNVSIVGTVYICGRNKDILNNGITPLK